MYRCRNTRPVFVELPVWPTLNFHGDPGSCPFNTKRREKLEKLRKEVKENREGIRAINQEEVTSDMQICLLLNSIIFNINIHE